MKTRVKRKIVYLALSSAFVAKVLLVNVTYTNLRQEQEVQMDAFRVLSQEPQQSSFAIKDSIQNMTPPLTIEALRRRHRLGTRHKTTRYNSTASRRNRPTFGTNTTTTNNKNSNNKANSTSLEATKDSRTTDRERNALNFQVTGVVASTHKDTGNMTASSSTLHTEKSPYAYAFLIGGVHEDRPAYRGFLYSVVIAAHLLKQTGSTMDVWLYVQLSPDSQLVNTLPDEDLRLLKAMNIQVVYADRPAGKESFSELVYDKFRILQMTDYRRVMFLDGDVIPLANMDYLFRLSDSDTPILQPNFIMASRGEPCNAGMFILEPKVGEWEALQDVIAQQHESAKNLPYPKFDREYGWGHSFRKEGDAWEGINKNGRMWRYHASHSDQGLLYYWVKYVKQHVSIAMGDNLATWGPGTTVSAYDGKLQPVKLREEYRLLTPYMTQEPLAWQERCTHNHDNATYFCTAPYREFAHFMGGNKPWQLGTGVSYFRGRKTDRYFAPYRLWFATLQELNAKLNMGLDFSQMRAGIPGLTTTPLGHMAMFNDHNNRVAAIFNISSSSNTTTTTTDMESNALMTTKSPSSSSTLKGGVVPMSSSSPSTQHSSSSYAYAFLIGGVHEDRPAYRGFLYNVLIAAQLLKQAGSAMDIWLHVQLSSDSQLVNTLPDEDLRLLKAMNIRVIYVDPPFGKESFNELVYDKFRILQMTNYRRVMFLDGDVIPLTNMDYLFRLSDPLSSRRSETPIVQPNFIMASRGEPCNAGMFILEPKVGEWEALQDVIAQQHESAKDLPYPKFDREYGWGHSFLREGDAWEGIFKNGTKWQYHASHSDQGLLYYWVKYVKQHVTIAMGDKLVTWGPGTSVSDFDGKRQPVRLGEVYRPLTPYMTSEPLAWQMSCKDNDDKSSYFCTAPYREFAHFMGGKKPWQLGTGVGFFKGSTTGENATPYRLWFATLKELNAKLHMGLDFNQMSNGIPGLQTTPLGHMAMFYDHHNRVAATFNMTTV
jgi:lipopolysaccharide biosynthesis glycosyltransferase